MMRTPRQLILPVNAALLAIGIIDLATTLYWLGAGRVIEMNPVMAPLLDSGVWMFVAVKLSTLAAYVGVMEWYRRRRSASFARLVGRFTVAAYLAIYAVSFSCVNYGYFLH